MKSKKIIVICAILAVVTVTAALLTACNTEEQIYSQIFDVCAKQNNLAITVKQGDITVYTYKDGAGHSDFEDLQIDASAYIQAAENAGKKLSLSDFKSDVKKSYEEVSGNFEIEGALADAKALLGIDAQATAHLKGNYIEGKVEIYTIAYQHNGFDVTITLV